MRTIVSLVMVVALIIRKSRCQSSNEPSRTKFAIIEEQPTGTVVGELKSLSWYTTNQHLQQANLSFTIVSLDGALGRKLFNVDPFTGVVRTATVVDRDSFCRRAITCVVDLDIGVQHAKNFELLKIAVEVADINDNPPRFPKSRIDHNISESMAPGILFPIDVADDPDSPRNGVARYQLVSNSQHFELQLPAAVAGAKDDELPVFVDPPLLVLRQPLDREHQQLHQMKIVAYDAGNPSNSGSVLLDIVVTDSNDNGPRFVLDHYRADVVENRLQDGPLVTVHAKDLDFGENAVVTYSLSRRSISSGIASTFAVNPTSGVVTLLKPLDYEHTSIFNFEVIASNPDPGEAAYPTATARVTVRVIDQNDNAPRINLDAATVTGNGGGPVVSVPENSLPDTLVAHLSVTDPDTGDAGFVDCTLGAGEAGTGQDATRYFRLVRVDNVDYQLLTSSAAVLDRESSGGGMFKLRVTCRDLGTEPGPLMASIGFRVSIADVNDNAPMFSHVVYNFSLNENAKPGTTIGQVSATDADSDYGGVKYLLHADASDFVAIDQITGQITSAVSFDHETASVLRFHVLASSSSLSDDGDDADASDGDHGSRQTASALVIVVILNVDDESPTFVEPAYEFQIPENQPLMKSVGRVTARDADSAPFDVFRYRLDGGPDAEQFVIDPKTGVISARQSLDRERQPTYRMTVFAESASLPVFRRGSANVTVHVTDENDNPPIVRYPAHGNGTLRISSYSVPGHVITRIIASDVDADDQLTFELSTVSLINPGHSGHHASSKVSSLFHVDRHTGDVKVARSLDPIADGTTFLLIITVFDSSSPPKSTIATLHLIVVRSEFSPETVWQPFGGGSGSMSPSSSEDGGDNFRLVLEGKVQLGVVVGIIAFSVVLMCALLATILVCRRRRRHRAATSEPKESAEMTRLEAKPVNQDGDRPEEDNGINCQTMISKDWTKLPVDVISNATTEIQVTLHVISFRWRNFIKYGR